MTLAGTDRARLPWWVVAALVGFWGAAVRLLGPQWNLYVQYNYGWAVPFLCGALLWRRWGDRPAPTAPRPGRAWAVAVTCALLLLPTRALVEANPIWRAASWAMTLELVGLTLAVIYLLGGGAWLRHFWFPIAFFLVAVPWPSQWEGVVVQALTRLNTAAVVETLTVLGIPATQAGNVIEVSNGKVGIDEACSGIRSLQATLMIAVFFGEWYRLTVRRRIGVVLGGVALAMICNMIRTFILVRVCAVGGSAALERWHDPTGVGILLVCFTAIWLIAERLGNGGLRAPASETTAHPPHALPRWVAPALWGWLVLVEGGTAAWFGHAEAAVANASRWSVRWPTGKPDLREVGISPRARAELKFDEGRSMGWREPDGSVWQAFYFRWGPARSLADRVRVQCARTHRPDICLPAAGRTLRRNLGVKDFAVANQTMPFRVYEFEERGRPLFVYWAATEDGTRGWLSNLRENTASRIGAALAGSRCVSQRVLQIAVWGYAGEAEAEAAVQRWLAEAVTLE
ncbi:MAG: exosortase/archaeosortase family protein [Verrucomicrobiae bacterium]|nr:exosortase/archaeosortase family protein [Verrucomicrobiae bacterium]MDW8309593.1 exosortase/archaeosortase family protein [Verrucomicrobiales bacterium]